MGSLYTSQLFESLLKSNNIKHSYSLKGHPYDNSYIEGFHSLLKREWVYQHKFTSIEHVILSIYKYIRWFNEDRLNYQKMKLKAA